MFQVQIEEEYIQEILQEAINAKVDVISKELVFWDMKELQRRTRMSVHTIKEQFFYVEDFPKAKVGSKWYFPAKETEEFLLRWLDAKRSSRY